MHQDCDRIAEIRTVIERVPRLLLIRLRSLGDCILTLPLLEALHSWRPELQLDILVEAPFRHVFSQHPAVRKLWVLNPRSQHHETGLTKLYVLPKVWQEAYPAVLNLHGGTTSCLFTLASRARFRIGQTSFRQSWAYNIHIPPSSTVWSRENVHTVEHQLTLLRWLGLPYESQRRGHIYLDPDARERMRSRLAEAGIEANRFFLVHPTATLLTKQWQEAKFAQLADALREQYGVPVIFSAAPHESEILSRVRQSARHRHHYWSDLRLDGLFALIEACSLFIGNDSGPTHAAAASGKPIVVVWGSSNFHAWHPWNADYEIVRSDLPCIPCPGYTCAVFGEPKCIQDIGVNRVLQSCDKILRRSFRF